MTQLLVQLNLESVQSWGIHHFLGEIITIADCSHCEKFPLVFQCFMDEVSPDPAAVLSSP